MIDKRVKSALGAASPPLQPLKASWLSDIRCPDGRCRNECFSLASGSAASSDLGLTIDSIVTATACATKTKMAIPSHTPLVKKQFTLDCMHKSSRIQHLCDHDGAKDCCCPRKADCVSEDAAQHRPPAAPAICTSSDDHV